MNRHCRWCVPVVAMCVSSAALAQGVGRATTEELDATSTTGQRFNFIVSAGVEHQFEAGLDSGGEFTVTRLGGGVGMQTDFNDSLSAAFHLSYGFDMYDFGGLGGPDTWTDIHRLTAAAIFSLKLSSDWTLFGGPIIQSSRESGADFDDSLTGGGAIGITYQAAREFSIGGGLVVMSQIEDSVRVAPIIVIDWQFMDHFHLRNTTTSAAATRTGIELVYEPSRSWEFAVGIARQFSRFRLDDDNAVEAGGVGEDSSWPFWFRTSYHASSHLSFTGIIGVNTSGEVRLEDSSGSLSGTTDYDETFFIGGFASLRF